VIPVVEKAAYLGGVIDKNLNPAVRLVFCILNITWFYGDEAKASMAPVVVYGGSI
jgi:hypothetical protein